MCEEVDMAVTLYRKQRQIVDFIDLFIRKHGYSPTLQEIADAIGVKSLATVHEHLAALTKKGVIRKISGEVRGIELAEQRIASLLEGVDVPLFGYIAAGQPIEAIENPSETINIPGDMVGKKQTYVLQVRGQSMIEAGILDGDYVVIERADTANNGEIVVALLENQFATLKRYFKEKDHIRLEPANSTMNPILAKSVTIQGKVIGIIRRYTH
jgi:repressor LexA